MAQISLGDEVRWWGEPHLGTSIFWEQQKARSLPVPSYARVLGKREYVDLVPHWRFKLASMASLSIDGSAMQLRFNAVTLEVLCDAEAHEDALNQRAKALGHMVPIVTDKPGLGFGCVWEKWQHLFRGLRGALVQNTTLHSPLVTNLSAARAHR
jgi:hypothetical protein